MSLAERVQRDMVAAMKGREAERLSALRMVKAALTNKAIEAGRELTEDEEHQVLRTMVKQRNEAAEAFDKGGRRELADKERTERAVIEVYLPEPASEEEIREVAGAVIAELGASSPRDMGGVMKETMARLVRTGKNVDGKVVSGAVRELLSAGRDG